MHDARTTSRLALVLLATTMLTQPVPAGAAPGDALGGEFQVNSFTTRNQINPAVAMDRDGDFVVAWESYEQDGSFQGIFAQRFDAAGATQGPEFKVNNFTTFAQRDPTVAMDADGDFVVAWESKYQDGNGYGVFARRFDATGAALGPEFQVNTVTTSDQIDPAVAMDADGNFVVAWVDIGGADGDIAGVFAQRYNAAGVARGSEFQVNTFTWGGQELPAISMDADGNFVVAWTDGYGEDIHAQRFNAAGVPQGVEFRVNTFTTDRQANPAVAADADGDFVVAWNSYEQDGAHFGVFARRFNSTGAARGAELQVNTFHVF